MKMKSNSHIQANDVSVLRLDPLFSFVRRIVEYTEHCFGNGRKSVPTVTPSEDGVSRYKKNPSNCTESPQPSPYCIQTSYIGEYSATH